MHTFTCIELRTPSHLLGPPVVSIAKEWCRDAEADAQIVSDEGKTGSDLQDLIDGHVHLVPLMARRLHMRLPKHVDFDDLVAAGNLGLVDAAARFKGKQHFQFRSFVQFRIRGAMLDSLRDMDWSPRRLRKQGRVLEEARQMLRADGVQTPTDSDLAVKLGLSLGQYYELVQELHSLTLASMNASDEDGDSDGDDIERIPAPENESPLCQVLQLRARELLAASISQLPERERITLSLYYYEELSMKDIGEVLNVSESRVSQIHASAISKIRALLRT